jgi:aromatic ring-cleaving dioxygenase
LRQKSAIAMSKIKSYHAHVYFNAATMVQAQKLCEEASAMLTPSILCGREAVVVGLVGEGDRPHPILLFGSFADSH